MGKARDEAQALQKRYRQDLPKQKAQALQCRQKYEARMAAFGLTTEQWQAVTQQYTREEADLFQEKLDAHKAQQAQAQGRYTSAKEQIGARENRIWKYCSKTCKRQNRCGKAGRKSGSSGAPMPVSTVKAMPV